MIAIQGMYDGKTIKPLEPIHAQVNTRVIIMFIEEQRSPSVPATRLEDVAGCLRWTGPVKTLADMDLAIEQGAKERKP
jgi:hypothetical protein